MSEDSENQGTDIDDFFTSDYLHDLMWEEINDPMVARVEAKMEARIQATLQAKAAGSSNLHSSYSRRYINRDHEAGHAKLVAEYFSEDPLYTDYQFRRRFRMRKHLFYQIVEALGNWSPYFKLRRDAFGKAGLSPLQKCIAALRMLAYGSPADLMDGTFGIAESTALECLLTSVRGVREVYGQQYLRRPTAEDIKRLLQVGEGPWFPGMLGSVDCMHWHWGVCPVARKGQFTRGDYKVPTIMLKAVASYDRWIWHAFFGTPDANNDINVLNQWPLFTQVLTRKISRG